MDFITKLPPSKEPGSGQVFDSILVIVDRLTKYAHFILYKETYTAEQLGHIVLDRLIRHHGMPITFVTDRDKLFTSNYWKTLVASMGIKHKLSTAFYPQTDGQTERTNQTLEVYLRHYVNYAQNNWVSLLPMAQLALNNNVSDTTKITPFFANYGKHPYLFITPKPHLNAERAIQTSKGLKQIHDKVHTNIVASQQKITKFLKDKRKMAPQLKKGDKVYLLTKNLTTRRKTKKLDHVKVGPFLIAEARGPVNYRLELPADAKIYPVFHVSLLEPADPETPIQTTFHYQTEEETEYEVEKILRQDGQKYLVKWKGYPDSENTWEPIEHLLNCQQLLRQFHHRNPDSPRMRWEDRRHDSIAGATSSGDRERRAVRKARSQGR